MQWTVRLEARTSRGEVETTELVTISRPAVADTFVDVGLALSEAKALLAKLQKSMVVQPGGGARHLPAGLPRVRGAAAPQGPAQAPAADLVRYG